MAPARPFPPISLAADKLTCERGGRVVLAGLDLEVRSGEFLAVTGPNGSGKSTLLRALAGLLRPESGAVRLGGWEGEAGAAHFLGHADALKPVLSLREALGFWAALYRDAQKPTPGHITCAARAVGLAHALDLPVGVLSAGQRRRAGLARLLVAPRPVWLLDEPAAALDREAEATLGELMREHLARRGLIVAATHQDLPVAPHRRLELLAAA